MDTRCKESLFGILFLIVWSVFALSMTVVAIGQDYFTLANEPFYRDNVIKSKEDNPFFFWSILVVWSLIGIFVGYRGVCGALHYVSPNKED